jgi:hypothetical protein
MDIKMAKLALVQNVKLKTVELIGDYAFHHTYEIMEADEGVIMRGQ